MNAPGLHAKRVAIVTTSYPQFVGDPSGHFVQTEARQLAQLGWSVTVLCPGKTLADAACSRDGVNVIRLGASGAFGWPGVMSTLRDKPWRSLQLPGFLSRVRRQLVLHRFDRVVAHWLVPCAWPLATSIAVPIEAVVHGSDARLVDQLPLFLKHILLHHLEQRGVRLRFVADHLKSLLTTPTNRAWINSSSVYPASISLPDGLGSKQDARARLGLAPEAFVAVIVARLVASKRISVALAKAPFPSDAQVVVVGSGPKLDTLRRQFPATRFIGQLPRTETLRWIVAADVVVNASRQEGLPTVLREARALGTRVWTADFGGATEWSQRDPHVLVLNELGLPAAASAVDSPQC